MTWSPDRGPVALVATDIQGSTALWEADQEAMAGALAVHDATLRRALAEAGGYELGTEGDAFFLAFRSVAAAAAFCVRVQRDLLVAPWPRALLEHADAAESCGPAGEVLFRGPRVRMGLVWGDPSRRGDARRGRWSLGGPIVALCHGVADAGHGGQILLDAATADALGPGAPGLLRSLGGWLPAGQEEPVELLELVPDDLSGRHFSRLRAEPARRSNLVASGGRFVGRGAELAALEAAVREGHRLITLVGPPGSGRTRLATELGIRLGERGFGSWRCELAGVTDGAALIGAVARGIGVPAGITAGGGAAGRLEAVLLARGPTVLLLDDVAPAPPRILPVLGGWMAACPELFLLATGTAGSSLPGELRVPVGPLSKEDAIDLYLERSPRAPGGEGAGEDRVLAGRVVEWVGGLPLSLELAAAQGREGEATAGLAGRSEGGGLEAVLRQTWARLGPDERGALKAASTFRGGFGIEGAEAVFGRSEDGPWADELVESLQDWALLRSWDDPGCPGELRFALLDSVATFSRAEFWAPEDLETVETRHARWCLEVVRREAPKLGTRHRREAVARIEVELANITQACRGSGGAGVGEELVRLVDPLLLDRGPSSLHFELLDLAPGDVFALQIARARALYRRGRIPEAERVLERVEPADARQRAELAQHWGNLSVETGRLEEAERLLSEAAEGFAALGDRRMEGEARSNQAIAVAHRGRLEEAAGLLQVAVARGVEVADPVLEARARTNVGILALLGDESELAVAQLRRALDLDRCLGLRRAEGLARLNLGTALRRLERPEEAAVQLTTGRRMLAALGDRRGAATAGAHLGCIRLDLGDAPAAVEELERVDRAFVELADDRLRAAFSPFLGAGLAELGRVREAEEVFERCEQLSASCGATAPLEALRLARGLLDPVAARAALEPSPVGEALDARLIRTVIRRALARRGG